MLSLVILGLSLLASAGVFGYERYLSGVRDSKAAAVIAAQERVDAATIEEFVRLRERFQTAGVILDGHIAASNFFDILETATLQNVRFDSLSLEVVEDGSAEIQMSGVARTFNALAAQSSVLAKEKYIKRAIFSDIASDETTDTVTFTLDADLDPRLLEFAVEDAPAVPETDILPQAEDGAPSDAETDAAAPAGDDGGAGTWGEGPFPSPSSGGTETP